MNTAAACRELLVRRRCQGFVGIAPKSREPAAHEVLVLLFFGHNQIPFKFALKYRLGACISKPKRIPVPEHSVSCSVIPHALSNLTARSGLFPLAKLIRVISTDKEGSQRND